MRRIQRIHGSTPLIHSIPSPLCTDFKQNKFVFIVRYSRYDLGQVDDIRLCSLALDNSVWTRLKKLREIYQLTWNDQCIYVIHSLLLPLQNKFCIHFYKLDVQIPLLLFLHNDSTIEPCQCHLFNQDNITKENIEIIIPCYKYMKNFN